MYRMYVYKHRKLKKVMIAPTITELYKHYVKHYATLGDKVYYYRCCRKRLDEVENEEIMISVFNNVFRNTWIENIKEEH